MVCRLAVNLGMRRKLLASCTETAAVVSSNKRCKSESSERVEDNFPDNTTVELQQTVQSAKDEKNVVDGKLEVVTSGTAVKMNRKMVALFMSYNGFGYLGMQFNSGFKTIESELLEAICKAGAISEENKFQLGNIQI